MNYITTCFRKSEDEAFYEYCHGLAPYSRQQCADMAYRVFMLCHVLRRDECDPFKIDTMITLMHNLTGVKIYLDTRLALHDLKSNVAHDDKRVADRMRMYSHVHFDVAAWRCLLQ